MNSRISGQPAGEAPAHDTSAVILFDGVCNLCNGAVLFVMDRDPARRFRFASLQSEAAARLLRELGQPPADLHSILLLEGTRCHSRSTAALRIARQLRAPWPLLYAFIVVPRPIRDFVYGVIARNRYRWFGRTESCRLPTPEAATRFLPEGATAAE